MRDVRLSVELDRVLDGMELQRSGFELSSGGGSGRSVWSGDDEYVEDARERLGRVQSDLDEGWYYAVEDERGYGG